MIDPDPAGDPFAIPVAAGQWPDYTRIGNAMRQIPVTYHRPPGPSFSNGPLHSYPARLEVKSFRILEDSEIG